MRSPGEVLDIDPHHLAPHAMSRLGEGGATKQPLSPSITVRATAPGFFANMRRSAGDVFDIPGSLFASSWMEKIPQRN
jgi:hypothetical protein